MLLIKQVNCMHDNRQRGQKKVQIKNISLLSILVIAFLTVMALGADKPGSVVVWGGASVYSYSPPEPNKDFVYISATSGSCLGLKADCSIKAWPTDLYMINELSESDTGFTAIDGGWDHVLALTPDGSIMAWGDNVSGQCDVPSPNSGFIEVSAGAHSMGLRNDGSIIVWGQSIFLWDLLDVPEPNSGFISISAGYFYCLGLKDNGSIVAWGWGMNGECDVPTPNSEFIAIDAGPNHCLGLKSDGSIIAWGLNNEGQCDVPAPNTGFAAIATGEFHSLGLKADGSIVAWGFNGFGQCDVPSPNSGFTAIAAGNLFSMGLKNQVTQTGSLQVTIEPQEAIEAGAKWRRVGTQTWFNSGYKETNVPVGQCTVEFKNVPGYLTATKQTGMIPIQGYLHLVGSYEPMTKPCIVIDGLIINDREYPYTENVPETLNVGTQVAIYGRTLGEDGLPMGNMEIAVTDPDRCQTLSFRSNTDGKFVYPQSFLEHITWLETSYPQFIFWLVIGDSIDQRVVVPLAFVDPDKPLSNDDYVGISAEASAGHDLLKFEGELQVVDESTNLPFFSSREELMMQPYLYVPGEVELDAGTWASLHNAVVRAEYMGGTLPFSQQERQQIEAKYDQYMYLKLLNDTAELTTNINHWIWDNKGTLLVSLVAAPVMVTGGTISAGVAVTGKLVFMDASSDLLLENMLPKVFGEDEIGKRDTKTVILIKKLILSKAGGVPPENAHLLEYTGFAYGLADTVGHTLYVLEDFINMDCPAEYIQCESLASSDHAIDVIIQAPSDPNIGLEATIIYINADLE